MQMCYFGMSWNNFPRNREITLRCKWGSIIQDYDIRHFSMITVSYNSACTVVRQHQLRGRGYNKNRVLYPRIWVDEINFAVLDVLLTMGLTRCYKTEGFFHLLLLLAVAAASAVVVLSLLLFENLTVVVFIVEMKQCICEQAIQLCTTSRAKKVVVGLTLVAAVVATINIASVDHYGTRVTIHISMVILRAVVPVAVLIINTIVVREVRRRASSDAASNLGLQHHQSTSSSSSSSSSPVNLVVIIIIIIITSQPRPTRLCLPSCWSSLHSSMYCSVACIALPTLRSCSCHSATVC